MSPEVATERIGDLYLDMANSTVLHLLDIVADRVTTATDEIMDTEFSTLVTAYNGLLFDYYLANTLSLSYFHAAMYLILTEPLYFEELGIR